MHTYMEISSGIIMCTVINLYLYGALEWVIKIDI